MQKPPLIGVPVQRPEHKVPAIFYFNLDDTKSEKKWRNPKEDITDYFNYGLNDETWKIYADKVVKIAEKVDKFTSDSTETAVLNDRIPLEFGVFGNPYFEKLRHLPFFDVIKKNKERFFF